MQLLSDREDSLIRLWPCTLLFSPNRIIRTTLCYTRDLVMLLLLHCSGINSVFIRKPQHIFFFKVLHVSNFMIKKEENDPCLQG